MPSQEENKPSYRVAGLLAFHLVSQVLDEAHIVANAAIESGHPWDYLSMRKNMRQDLTYVISPGEVKYVNPPGDYIEINDTAKEDSDVLVTSTPQKNSDDKSRIETLIGQGDEEVERQNELSNSTSMFIHHLFDMSDVEQVIGDDTEENNDQLNELTQEMSHMDTNDNDTAEHTQKEEALEIAEKTSTANSSFSLLAEDLVEDDGKDVMFCIDNYIPSCADNICEIMQEPTTSQRALQQNRGLEEVKVENSELYENAYLTMNRDYDQCSDEDGYPILQDPKGMIMQEIELLTADTSDDDSAPREEPVEAEETKQKGNLAATSAVSASSRKSGIVTKCRLQGARLLACLRGWWRRKTPGKRKEARVPGSRRGICPMSPSARRRASSLLDHHRSPPPVRGSWKFNTLNEALVNSNVWKDYTFEETHECGDV